MKSHMKRLASPKTWPIMRKKYNLITRPMPGGQAKELCMPLNIILRDILKHAATAREAKTILRNNTVLVNGKKTANERCPVGFMDTLSIKETDENYRILIDHKGKLALKPISASESGLKICKINRKVTIKKGKTQLCLNDGRTITTDKGKTYSTGDGLLIKLPSQEIAGHIKLEKKALVYLLGGKHTGHTGTVEDVKEDMLTIKIGDTTIETPKRFAFPLGKEKTPITTSV